MKPTKDVEVSREAFESALAKLIKGRPLRAKKVKTRGNKSKGIIVFKKG
jgi:hypothetical protein